MNAIIDEYSISNISESELLVLIETFINEQGSTSMSTFVREFIDLVYKYKYDKVTQDEIEELFAKAATRNK